MGRKIDYIVIHCSATREGSRFTFEQCRNFHIKKRGWSDIGYHFYIEKDGEIHVGRKLSRVGAHVKGYNFNSVGICYEGGLDENGKPKDTRTPEQKTAILHTIADIISILQFKGQNIDDLQIVGHRDLSPDRDGDGVIEKSEWIKSCPCFDAKKEYANR